MDLCIISLNSLTPMMIDGGWIYIADWDSSSVSWKKSVWIFCAKAFWHFIPYLLELSLRSIKECLNWVETDCRLGGLVPLGREEGVWPDWRLVGHPYLSPNPIWQDSAAVSLPTFLRARREVGNQIQLGHDDSRVWQDASCLQAAAENRRKPVRGV